MFVVFVVSALTTVLWAQALVGQGEAPASFIGWVCVWLWFTVIFANFAEAMAEGRGKAQAANLRKTRRDVTAKKLTAQVSRVAADGTPLWRAVPPTMVSGSSLRRSDVVL